MKKYLIILLIFLAFISSVNRGLVYAAESNYNETTSETIDETIDEIIGGIDESDFKNLVEIINGFFGENKSFKELIISFFTGELNVDFISVKNYFINRLNGFGKFGGEVIIYLLCIGVLFNLSNIISSKNSDNTAKYIIYFTSVCIAVTMLFGVIEKVFSYATEQLDTLNTATAAVFPVLFSVAGLIGGFGVTQIKPFVTVLTLIFSSLSSSFFIPLLRVETSISAVGNLCSDVKLDGLKKTVSSLYKWALAFACGIFSITIVSQGLVNSQYNGLSVKILKYLTGSFVPIVGGFLSGGMEAIISSAALIKNSIGLLAVLYVMLTVWITAIEILIFSFFVKFAASLFQSVIDEKFYNLIVSVTDVFKSLAALLLVCGFLFIITTLSFVSATACIF